MHKFFLIAKHDYLAAIRSKPFLFGLIVTPLLSGGGFIGIGLMKARPDIQARRIAIVDHTGVASDTVIQTATEKNDKDVFDKIGGKQVKPRYSFENVPPEAD